mmetsp:Transcript_11515/g.33065  ORF Transcript_11515/g.33065 Transcript_11515/m.33065 type:complete len:120 (+) Transcript_11515:970-1329(+)
MTVAPPSLCVLVGRHFPHFHTLTLAQQMVVRRPQYIYINATSASYRNRPSIRGQSHIARPKLHGSNNFHFGFMEWRSHEQNVNGIGTTWPIKMGYLLKVTMKKSELEHKRKKKQSSKKR